jgi:hypothetical protein
MPDTDRLNFDAVDMQAGFRVNRVQLNAGQPRNGLAKDVCKPQVHIGGHAFLGVHRHRVATAEIEGTNVVQPNHMVVVLMGEQDGVEVADSRAQHLLAQIRTGVYQDVGIAAGEQGRRAQALVVWISRGAYPAFAPDHGHALGCSGTE